MTVFCTGIDQPVLTLPVSEQTAGALPAASTKNSCDWAAKVGSERTTRGIAEKAPKRHPDRAFWDCAMKLRWPYGFCASLAPERL